MFIKSTNKVHIYFSEVLLLALLLGFYIFGFYYSNLLNFYTKITLLCIYLLYIIILLPISLFRLNGQAVFHSDIIINIIYRLGTFLFAKSDNGLRADLINDKDEKRILLFFLVKIIFIPIMLNFSVEFMIYILNFLKNPHFSFNILRIDYLWFFLLSALMCFIDALYFSFGYLVEHNKLNNKVISVDGTVLGWIVTLACYKPFNNVSGRLFPMYAQENVFFINEQITTILYIAVIILYLIYMLATFALGFKCSNLTNRGIVSRGIYKIVRHPAYSAKLLAWWLLCLPIMNVKVLISMLVWTVIYLLRAYTEERHLSMDQNYVEYMKQTKYRFIPKLY